MDTKNVSKIKYCYYFNTRGHIIRNKKLENKKINGQLLATNMYIVYNYLGIYHM